VSWYLGSKRLWKASFAFFSISSTFLLVAIVAIDLSIVVFLGKFDLFKRLMFWNVVLLKTIKKRTLLNFYVGDVLSIILGSRVEG